VSKFSVQFALVLCDDGFQGGGGLFIFIQGFGLGCQGSSGLVAQMFGHPQRVVELELEPGGVVEGGADELLQVVQSAGAAQTGTLFGVRFGLGALSQFSGNRIQLRLIAKYLGGVF